MKRAEPGRVLMVELHCANFSAVTSTVSYISAMSRLIDLGAKNIAVQRFALPECLHVPVAAANEQAILDYVGQIKQVLASGQPNRAVLVEVDLPPQRDVRLPIWKEVNSPVLHKTEQVWVRFDYSGYRRAYKKAFPDEDISQMVLSHCMNRRHANIKGFRYVRIVPTSRATNSSSAFSEVWGIETNSKLIASRPPQRNQAHIQYADLVDLLVMLDLKVGGGVMETVNTAQQLITPKIS